jgi:hypothetical protein
MKQHRLGCRTTAATLTGSTDSSSYFMASFGPTAQFDCKSNGELGEFKEMSEAEFARYVNTAAIKGQFLFRRGNRNISALFGRVPVRIRVLCGTF